MKRLCDIRSDPLNVDEVIAAVERPEAGAIALFSGVVRNHADGRAVSLLEYEVYPAMAVKEMAKAIAAIEAEINGVQLAVIHRVGTLQVGEVAVVCAASSPHREEAFEACRQCIDRIKATVPIWKREHGPHGPYWVGWRDARCLHGSHAGHDSSDTGTVRPTAHGHAHLERGEGAPHPLNGITVSVLTISDSRTSATDDSGRRARELLVDAGAHVAGCDIVRDEPDEIATWVRTQVKTEGVHALVLTGGTGITRRDRTIEAVTPLISYTLDGFGETFRRLSFEKIGARALISRAMAGVIDSTLVFALPGSPQAVELALTQLVIPMLPHAIELLTNEQQSLLAKEAP